MPLSCPAPSGTCGGTGATDSADTSTARTSTAPSASGSAPLLYQARGLIVVVLIGVWPYTRLAGILSVPALRVLRQAVPPPYRSAPTV